jgi:hypothetical protein
MARHHRCRLRLSLVFDFWVTIVVVRFEDLQFGAKQMSRN